MAADGVVKESGVDLADEIKTSSMTALLSFP